MQKLLGCVLGAVIVGCGSAEPSPEVDGVRRFTLSGEIGATEGVVLETGEIVDVTWDDLGGSDIYLTMAMSMMLHGVADGSFCFQGEGFAAVDDIPADAAACEWRELSLSGNAPGLSRTFEADGYLFFDAEGAKHHRLLVVEHSIDAEHVGAVTFDLSAVD